MHPEANPYTAPTVAIEEIRATGDGEPALWNPNAAASWSLLLSPVFGSYLQMRNWQALGESEKAAASWHWCIGTLVITLLAIGVGMLAPDGHWLDKLTSRSGLFILLAWYFANGKQQGLYVKERFGKTYPRKGWGVPLLVAFGTIVGLLVVLVGSYMLLVTTGLVAEPT
jgi:hypothetical protein